jgi:hypothetical protein
MGNQRSSLTLPSVLARWQREKQHLLDGTPPNIPTRHTRRTLEADSVLFRLPIDDVAEMDDKHFALEIQLLHLRPSKMLCSFAGRKRTNPREIDAQVQLGAAMILHRVRINTVGFQATRNADKLIVDSDFLLARVTFFV